MLIALNRQLSAFTPGRPASPAHGLKDLQVVAVAERRVLSHDLPVGTDQPDLSGVNPKLLQHQGRRGPILDLEIQRFLSPGEKPPQVPEEMNRQPQAILQD